MFFEKLITWLDRAIVLVIVALLLTTSSPQISSAFERARVYTRNDEFDFVQWTLDAVWVKVQQAALGSPYYFDREASKSLVLEFFRVSQKELEIEYQLDQVYANPNIADPETESAAMRAELETATRRKNLIQPMAEAVIEGQVTQVAAELGLTVAGQPVPPVLAHITPLPYNLVVSPRDKIQQDFSISLSPNLTVDKNAVIEDEVDKSLDVSSLVVPIGGLASYPTMVMQSGWMEWTIDTFAHEWSHNYLTWHPLGFQYGETPELRTMNETTASIFGTEVGKMIIERYYPELADHPSPPLQTIDLPAYKPDPDKIPRPVFDYRAEMHTTRAHADELLAEGKIDEAEAYMEARRVIFWDHGYTIRKLNQAYFAFFGAYADVPGGAAGEDPVGPAVRLLRENSRDLGDFLRRMSWMMSWDDMQKAITKLKAGS